MTRQTKPAVLLILKEIPPKKNKLDFNHHISSCNSVSNQLNAYIRLKYLLRFKDRKVLINNFVMSNFNYCSQVWNFSSAQSFNKIENLQKRALLFLLNDYCSTYEDLLETSCCQNMNLRRQRTLRTEIYKTLNKLNPGYNQVKTQSSNFWNKKPKQLRSENTKSLKLPYRNFIKLK